jgi:hypothetical protein
MYALYEDAGKFHAGRVMSETESSLQIELGSGKRAKVKAARAAALPARAEALISAASTIAADIDLDLAWEFAPRATCLRQLAKDYFGESTGTTQQAAALSACGRRTTSAASAKAIQEGARRDRRDRAARHRAQRQSRPRSTPGRPSSPRAPARRRYASSSTASCSSRTRTRPSTRRSSMPPDAPAGRRSSC